MIAIAGYQRISLPCLIFTVALTIQCTSKAPRGENSNPVPGTSEPFVVINNETLFVEISTTPKERARGLMFRDSLPENNGMFFIFEFEARHPFWMKNTTIPLSIAFINNKHTIVDIKDMVPLSLEACAPRFPCLYALEVNQQWFKKRGIRIGDSVHVHF